MKSPFIELGLTRELAQVLTGLGYEEPTPIQSQAIPPLLEGRDLLGQAATGTGKTGSVCAADAAADTRGPAQDGASGGAGAGADARTGDPGGRGAAQLRCASSAQWCCRSTAAPSSADRLRRCSAACMSSWRRRAARSTTSAAARSTLARCAIVVLDEADEMLDMGFAEDIERSSTRRRRSGRRRSFSATMPPRIAAIANKHLRDPVRVAIAREEPETANAAPCAPDRLRRAARAQGRRARARARLESPTLALVFAARAPRSMNWPKRCAAAATRSKRCTAACRRISATA